MERKVLHLLESGQPPSSAMARVVAHIARGLTPQGYRSEAWFLNQGGPLEREIEQAGGTVRLVRWPGGKRDPAGAWRFWSALRGERFDIVHVHAKGESVSWMARRASDAKVLRYIYNYVDEPRGVDPAMVTDRYAHAVAAVSHATASYVAREASVIHLGVEVAPAPVRRPHEDLVVGFAGRLDAMKGVTYLLRAIASAAERVPTLRAEIVGDGTLGESLREEARSLGIEQRVAFLGWRPDWTSLLAGWDVFVQPSIQDAFPTTTLEAMAGGVPVIASAVGGLPESVDDAVGWLAPPHDPSALADAICEAAERPREREERGRTGRQRVIERFTAEGMVSRFREMYERLLAEDGAPGV